MMFVRRIGTAVVLFWLVVTLTFVLIRLAPGDPAAFLVPPGASEADAARVRAELGLDRSMLVQYARWFLATLSGDLGTSFGTGRPVTSLLAEAAPISLWLGGVSLALTFLIGVPVGMLQAARRGRFTDRALTVLTTAVYAAPSFWLALALVAQPVHRPGDGPSTPDEALVALQSKYKTAEKKYEGLAKKIVDGEACPTNSSRVSRTWFPVRSITSSKSSCSS